MAQQVWCHHEASGSPSVPASHISSTQNSTFHIKNPHKTRSNSGLIKISSLNRHSKSILLAQKRSRRWGWRFQVPVLTCWQGTVTDLCDQKLPPVLPQHTQVLAASAHLHHPPLQGGTGPPISPFPTMWLPSQTPSSKYISVETELSVPLSILSQFSWHMQVWPGVNGCGRRCSSSHSGCSQLQTQLTQPVGAAQPWQQECPEHSAPIPPGTATRGQCYKHTRQNHPFFLGAKWLTEEGLILSHFKQDSGFGVEEPQALSEQTARKKGKSSRCQCPLQQPPSILRDPGMIHFLQCFKDAVLNCSCTFTACGNTE